MNSLKNLLFSLVALSLMAIGCQSPDRKAKNTEGDSPKTEKSKETKETEDSEKTLSNKVLNANLATQKELNGLGLSPEIVKQIIDQRPFLSAKDLDNLIKSVEDYKDLYTMIFVPFNLNTTPEEDFKMIPGVGDRMAHEFEEYRPYTSIKQFRKEIGKYVDDAEVARYENYVFVPVELNSASEEDIKALPGVGDRMAHEFEEYRPYTSMEQFRKEIGKYVDDKELARLERLVYIKK